MTDDDDDGILQNEFNGGPEKTGNLNKACEACRGSKLRCIVDDDALDGCCKRCLATRRTCIFKAPRQRQRRKVHVDVRVAELERQLRSLRLQLQQAQNPSSLTHASSAAPLRSTLRFEPPVTPQSWPRKTATVAQELDPKAPSYSGSTASSLGTVRSVEESINDVIDRNVIGKHEADRLVHIYLADFASSYPFVTLPSFTDTDTLRHQRPATFLAVLAAASVTSSPHLHKTFNHELLALLARRIMLEGEHNLDLVQAMIITTIWYAPMDKFESLRHYQFAHLAATIAMDLGLGDSPAHTDVNLAENDDMDRQRTLLSIYLLCTGVSITTGRSKMLRFTDYMENCIGRFKSRVGPSVQDQWFVAWIDLQRLTEFAANQFFIAPTDITIPSNQEAVADFCRTLDHWKRDLGFELGGALEIHYHYVRSIVLSVCLYGDHDMSDFLPPFRVKPSNAPMPPPSQLSPFLARTAMALVQNVHSALDSFLSFSTVALLAAPVIYYIRTLHPFSILLMLDMARRRPGNDLSKILDQEGLKVAKYFLSFKQMLLAYEEDPRETPAKFLAIIKRMEAWWVVQCQPSTTSSPDLRPFGTLQNPLVGAGIEARNNVDNPPPPSIQSTSTHCWVQTSPADPGVTTGKLTDSTSVCEQGATEIMDSDTLFQDNWVIDFDHDPSAILLPEIDWALFEEREITNAI